MRAMSVATLILLRAAAAGAEPDTQPQPSEPQQPGVATTAPGRPQDVPNEAVPQSPAPASAPGPGELPETPQIQWQLAPIVYGGDLGYEMRMTRNEGQPATLEQIVLANIRGRSYVWQPWFAQVRGGLGLVLSREHIANDGSGNAGLVDQKPVTVTGNFGLTVFPVSRFPFDASFERTDSRTSGAIASSDYTSTLMSLRQSYSSLDGNTHLSARFERSILESESFGRDTLDNIEANLAQTLGNHNLEFETGYSQNVHEQTEERSTIERASLRDTYRPNNLLTVESLAYVNSTDFDSGTGTTTPSSNSRTSQVTSFATWRPAEQSPLYMTGSLRLLSLDTDTTGTPSHSQSLNGTVGANYQYTQYTRLFATAGFTENRTAEARTNAINESVGATYTPAFIPLGKWMYSWTASVTAANQTVTDEGSRQALSGSLGHNVMRSFMQTEESQASVNLGQSVTTVYDTVDRSTSTLTHSAGLSWNRARESGTLDFASATISDSHSWGATQGDFQLLNLQATRQATLSRVSSWSGNVTIQATRQHAEAIAPSPVLPLSVPQTQSRAVSYSANLTYEHQRAFGINNLRFSALATANSQQLQSRQQGDVNAPPEYIDNSVEIRFDYLIGRLMIRLSARSAEISDRRQNQILLRITRSFGSL